MGLWSAAVSSGMIGDTDWNVWGIWGSIGSCRDKDPRLK